MEEQNELNKSDIQGRQMVYAADGTLLRKRDGVQSQLSSSGVSSTGFGEKGLSHHISSNGQYLGEISEHGSSSGVQYRMSLKDQHFSSAPDSASAQSKYQVQAGDTLRSLALAFYGNSDYWYLIANSNGLTGEPDKALSAGLAIDIPARADSRNSSNSFKPMDLQQIIGDTTPAVPYLPPPPRAGCNALAMVVMIAITVVATVATAGAAAGASGGLASMMSAGASVMTGGVAAGGLGAALGATWGGIAAAAVGGFVGSVAGQLTGKAMGVVDSFSLKNAFASGLTAGATAGMGSWMGVGGSANGTLVSGATAATDTTAATVASLNAYGKIAMAASSAGISVAANKLAGNQASFQWRNVVTGAVTAGVMDKAGLSNPNSVFERFNEGAGVVSGFMDGIAGAAIGYGVSKSLYNEGSWNFRNVATDSFGNAVGNSIVGHYVKKDLALTQFMEEQGLNPQDANARKIVERYQNASRVGVSPERYADALEAMDSLFPEHSADADPRKLNMARLTASTKPIAFGEGDSFVHVGMMSHEGVTGERYAYTGKPLSPL